VKREPGLWEKKKKVSLVASPPQPPPPKPEITVPANPERNIEKKGRKRKIRGDFAKGDHS